MDTRGEDDVMEERGSDERSHGESRYTPILVHDTNERTKDQEHYHEKGITINNFKLQRHSPYLSHLKVSR